MKSEQKAGLYCDGLSGSVSLDVTSVGLSDRKLLLNNLEMLLRHQDGNAETTDVAQASRPVPLDLPRSQKSLCAELRFS